KSVSTIGFFTPAQARAPIPPFKKRGLPAISAFTRVHSPSKTGVNALKDALCAGTTWFALIDGVRSVLRLRLRLQHASRHRVELLQKLLVARFRRGDQRGIERAVRTDGAGVVLA